MFAIGVLSLACSAAAVDGNASRLAVIQKAPDFALTDQSGKPLASERWLVQPTGQIVKTPLTTA